MNKATILAVCMSASALLTGVPTSQAHNVILTLPQPVAFAATATVDGVTYEFGGFTGSSVGSGAALVDTIVRVDPANLTASTLPVKLPEPAARMASAVVGTKVYLMGGATLSEWSDRILVFDTVTQSLVEANVTLPQALVSSTAASDGRNVYVFGGRMVGGNAFSGILKFDPESPQVTSLRVGFRPAFFDAAAIFAPSTGNIYVIGGNGDALSGTSGGAPTAGAIYRFDPTTETLELMRSHIPTSPSNHGLALRGDTIYVIGGGVYGVNGVHVVDGGGGTRFHTYLGESNRIWKFEYAADLVELSTVQLEIPLAGMGVAPAPDGFLTLGGNYGPSYLASVTDVDMTSA